MEICFVGTGVLLIPPTYGGAAERAIFELGCALARNKEIYVRIIDYEHPVPEKPKNLEYAMINKKANLVKKHSFFSLLALLKSREFESDVFHCSLAISSIIFSKVYGRTVYTSHSPFWFDPTKFDKKEIVAIRNASYNIAISKDIYRKMKEYNQNTEYVPNGVNIHKFKPGKRSSLYDILFVGRISPQKGLEYLVDAVAEVRREIPDVKVRCVGPTSFYGDLESEYLLNLRRRIRELGMEDTFLFTRKVDEQELLQSYRNSSIFVLPSLSEGMPLVVLEAMACGLPVITSDVSGVRDVVTNDVGRIVPKGDSKALATAILELLQNKSLMKKISKKARERAKQFSWERIAKKTLGVYKKVIL
ncbi:MAG: glycosyltransferase family 4 protein [Candidatus Micrarchaeia archaeon]